MRISWTGVVGSLAALAAGCGPEPVTLLVQLRTDYVVGVEVDAATVTFDDEAPERIALEASPAPLELRRLVERRLLPGTHALRVTLYAPDGRARGESRLAVTLTTSQAVTAQVERRCEDVVCPPPEGPSLVACSRGVCVSPECNPELPSACPAAECQADADCPPRGACARPSCAAGVCFYPDPGAACGAGRFCAGEEGCQDLPTRRRCRWPEDPSELVLGAPEPVGDSDLELTPFLTADHLALYVSRHYEGNPDLYVYRRPDPAAPFGAPEPLTEVNGPFEDRKIEITPDGLHAILAAAETDRAMDLFRGRRARRDAPWVFERDPISGETRELDPHLTQGGLELWWRRDRRIFRATRPSLDGPFGPPVEQTGLGDAGGSGSVSLTDDGLTAVFHAVEDDGAGVDLYYVVRDSREAPFGEVRRVPGLSRPSRREWTPFVRDDGCELFYVIGHYRSTQLYRVSVGS